MEWLKSLFVEHSALQAVVVEPPVLPAQQENIEREAVDMLEGITALMTGYNEVHDIIPTI